MIDFLMGKIEILLYIGLIAGIFLVFSDAIVYESKDFLQRLQRKVNSKKENRIISHLTRMFELTGKNENVNRSVVILLVTTALIFIFVFFLMIRQDLIIIGFVFSAFIALCPYGYIRAKIATNRVAGSFEGELVISEFLYQYKLNAKNVIAAIDSCVVSLSEKESVSKRAFYRLSMKVKTIKTEEELQSVLDDFVSATNTVWARTLANNMFNAIYDKTDIIAGLEDLVRECKKISAALEEGRRSNMEGLVMVRFLSPAFFVLFAYLSTSTGITWQEVLGYEFNTPVGVILFSVIIVVFAFNLIFSALLSKQKYDI